MSGMRGTFTRKGLVSLILVMVILAAAILTSYFFLGQGQTEAASPAKCYVGVAFCGNTSAEARLLIDRVKSYTNLFVLQSGPVSWNETATYEVCDYAVAAGLKIVVYFGDLSPRALTNQTLWRVDWVKTAKQRWNDNILGVYYYDEPGGIWLDTDWSQFPRAFNPNSTYASAANLFARGFQRDAGRIFAEEQQHSYCCFGLCALLVRLPFRLRCCPRSSRWIHTMQQNVALVRGAAQLQNKTWGVIVTWKYTEIPYLASGDEVLDQMVNAYAAGAKYIVLFNYPQIEDNPYGAMRDEHFRALEEFWNQIASNPKLQFGSATASAALVLPRNYGWGMRNPNDTIWGMWGPDEKSPAIWNITRALLNLYGFRLDIVYDDPNFPVKGNYTRVYYSNETI